MCGRLVMLYLLIGILDGQISEPLQAGSPCLALGCITGHNGILNMNLLLHW